MLYVLSLLLNPLLPLGIFLLLRNVLNARWPHILRGEPAGATSPAIFKYEVLGKKGKLKALRSDGGFNMSDALTYVLFYVIGLPLLAYRYGWRYGIKIVWLPLALTAGVLAFPLLLSALFGDDIGGLAFLGLSVSIAAPRAVVGLWVGVKSEGWRRETLLRRDWSIVAVREATNSKEALRSLVPERTRRGVRKRLAAKWSAWRRG